MHRELKISALHRGIRVTIAVSISTAVLATCAFTGFRAHSARPASHVPQDPVRVQLFDVYSGVALLNAAVEVPSDNGIACSPGELDDSGCCLRVSESRTELL